MCAANTIERMPQISKRVLSLLTLVVCLFLIVGCPAQDGRGTIAETDETRYRDAKNLERQGRYAQALNEFLKVIESRREAPESHLEAGNLYLRHVGDPVAAIYHFRQYLKQKPDSEQAEQVRQLIQTAKKEFAKSFPAQPFNDQIEREDLLDMIAQLREENEELRRELAAAQQQLTREQERTSMRELRQPEGINEQTSRPQQQPRVVPQQPREQAGATVVRTHTIQAGDTLSGISRQYYGTAGRWREIYEANRDRIPNPDSLPVGVTLRLPQ